LGTRYDRAMRGVLLFRALALTVSAAACSNEGEPGSCYRSNDNACVDYDRSQGAAGKRMCSGMKWTHGARSCPTENRLGACARKGGTEWLYGGAPNNYTPASARSACEWDRGVFTPSTH
jgi:hypothetical protein